MRENPPGRIRTRCFFNAEAVEYVEFPCSIANSQGPSPLEFFAALRLCVSALIVPSRAEVERGHLAGVSYQQNSTGNNGDVPGLAFDPRNASKLTVRVRCGLDEDKLTALGDNAK